MTKKGRRASERRNEQDEPTKAARQGTKTDVTVVGTDLSGLKTSQGQVLEDRGALSETQEKTDGERSEASMRFAGPKPKPANSIPIKNFVTLYWRRMTIYQIQLLAIRIKALTPVI